MNGEFKLIIGRAVREMAQFYSSEESFCIKKGKHLPNRGAIIGVIKDLRRVMFPGYFGTENITDTAPAATTAKTSHNVRLLSSPVEGAEAPFSVS